MIESNNEKTFICVSFYTNDEKLCEYDFFGEKLKNQDKLIQLGHQDSIPKTGTVPAKPGLLECLKKEHAFCEGLTVIHENSQHCK